MTGPHYWRTEMSQYERERGLTADEFDINEIAQAIYDASSYADSEGVTLASMRSLVLTPQAGYAVCHAIQNYLHSRRRKARSAG